MRLNSGARGAPHASRAPSSSEADAEGHATARLGAPARRCAGAPSVSRMPGTKTSEKSWMARSAISQQDGGPTRADRTGACFPAGFSASGPAPPSERAQTRVASRAPQAPRSLSSANSAPRPAPRHAMRLTCAASLRARAARLAPLTRRRLWMRDARALRTATRSTDDGRSSSTKLSSAAEKRGTAGGRGRVGFLSQLRSSSIGAPPSLSIVIQPRLRLRVRYFALEVRRF